MRADGTGDSDFRKGEKMRHSKAAAAALIWLTALSPARAAESGLVAQPDLAPNIGAFPRLAADPAAPAAQRINRALAGLDKKFAAATAECRQVDSSNEVTRTVDVTMKGARYLGLVAEESWFCGGAYPDHDTLALTYDLGTGRPVDWTRLMPPSLGLKASLDNTFDGTAIGVVTSNTLSKIYTEQVSKAPDFDKDCLEAFSMQDLTFQLWPSAKEGGVAVQPANLPHVAAACGDTIVIPAARLRELGADASLLADIEAAQSR